MDRKTIDYYYRSTWLAIARMYTPITAQYDLTVTAVLVLINIDKKNGTSSTKIAPEIGLEPRSITRVLKSLENKGLIKREKLTSDKREVTVSLTPEGLAQRSVAVRYIKHFHNVVMDEIPTDDLESFFKVSDKINELIKSNKIYNEELKNSIELEYQSNQE